MSTKQIKSLVQFSRGSSLVWGALTTPIPDGVATFSIDDGTFKIGNGVDTYQNLPSLFTFADLLAAQGGVSALFTAPTLASNGYIVVIEFDALSGKTKYAVSTTTLAGLLASLTALENTNVAQDAAIAQLLAIGLSIDVSINTGPDGNIVTIQNGRYSDSGQNMANIQASISAGVNFIPGSHLSEPVFYSDITKIKVVDKMKLYDNTTYYADIVGVNNSVTTPVFTLTSPNTNITITKISGSLFSLVLNGVTSNDLADTPVVLKSSIDGGDGKSTVKKAIAIMVIRQRILVSIYGGSGTEQFAGPRVDNFNNIYVVGYTSSEGLGLNDGLIIKFDSNLNIIAKKRYGGTGDDSFNSIVIDSVGNIIVAGYTSSEGLGLNDGLIVKFDSNLNIIARKRYGGTGDDYFRWLSVDQNNNIIVIGSTSSEGVGSGDGIIIKFDSNLNILVKKRYGGSVGAVSILRAALYTDGNILVVGNTSAEGPNVPAAINGFIIKFDANLNILARKVYGGTGTDAFISVAIDASNNCYAVGQTTSEGLGGGDALIVKFDTNLNILASKRYGGSGGQDVFRGVEIDSVGNIICVGNELSEGLGGATWGDAFIVRFDSNLNIIAKKRYGGTGDEQFLRAVIDSFDNIICVGVATSTGLGGNDAIIVKMPFVIPTGTFTGAVISSLTMADITTMVLNDVTTLTLANSTLTLADITTLTLANSTLTLATSNLYQTIDSMN